MRAHMPITPRELVTRRIAARASSFPNFDLTPMDVVGLDGRDAALARAIDHAVARRWLTLATVIDSQLDQEWGNLQPKVQAPLLVGAAQLLLLERLPDHAVINEAVEWTKANARTKAGGLANAVLRRVARLRDDVVANFALRDEMPRDLLPLDDGRCLKLATEVFDEDPARRLAQQTSHSHELLLHWIRSHGREKAVRLALHSLVHAPVIVTGVEANASPHLLPHRVSGFFVYTGPREQLDSLLASAPYGRVQDPGTAAAMKHSSGLNPRLIIDLCAGRGTKTAQLRELHPHADIVATDMDEGRFQVLQRTFAGSDHVRVVPFAQISQFNGMADLLILDVPCSNTGVLARRVEAKYRFTLQSLEAVRDIQRQIIADAIPLLSGNARLLYATCSIERIENRDQARWMERWLPLHVVNEVITDPRGLPGDPDEHYSDGGYAVLLQTTL